MEKEYDFSKGVRGKFYRPDAELYLPIYIDPDMMEVLRKFSKKIMVSENNGVTHLKDTCQAKKAIPKARKVSFLANISELPPSLPLPQFLYVLVSVFTAPVTHQD